MYVQQGDDPGTCSVHLQVDNSSLCLTIECGSEAPAFTH